MAISIFTVVLALLALVISPPSSAGLTYTDTGSEASYEIGYYGIRVHATWVITPNLDTTTVIPCPKSFCMYGLLWRYDERPLNNTMVVMPVGGFGTGPGDTATYIYTTPGMTWAQASDAFAAKFGSSGTVSRFYARNPPFQEYCVGAVANWRDPDLFRESSSSCTTIPLVPVMCSMTGTVEIDHGVLNPSQMAGHTASATGRLSCSRPATIRVRVIPPTVDLGGGWMSTLQIDGVGDGGTITTSGSTDLSFVSRLSGSSTTTGPLTGTSIVILDAE